MLNLDTHILIFASEDRLTQAEHRVMERDSWCISAIVLWEVELLARAGRVKTDLSSPDLRRMLAEVEVIPIDVNIARNIRLLDFRSDPADELIAATSLQLNVPLVTRDSILLGSKIVPIVRF